MGSKVTGCAYDEKSETWQLHYQDQHGHTQTIEAEHVISSAPMRELARGLTPPVLSARNTRPTVSSIATSSRSC